MTGPARGGIVRGGPIRLDSGCVIPTSRFPALASPPGGRVELKIDGKRPDFTEHMGLRRVGSGELKVAEDAHECRSNLSLPMAPWLLARAARRMWRKLARWWR